ncbi:MAG: ABC transporter ATP-binding protein [Candidatus Zixiibacteriota bacterium]
MATVQFDAVTKDFDGVRALDAVSFTADDGEFIVLVGPSGCGKSTALRLIAGLEEPDSGRIRINGVDVNGRPPKERGCAMVFQSYALYPHWSVYDNLAFPLRVRRLPREEIHRRVTTIAGDLQLSSVLERRPKALSGGQRQRVALGRAMAADPAIFLFDEPLSNLDAPLRAGMRAEIVARQKAMRKTSLYVTHDQAEALTMADRIVVLDSGRVQAIGPPEDLYRNPPNRFVAEFLGRPTINLVSVGVVDAGGQSTLEPLGWILPVDRRRNLPARGASGIIAGIRAEHLAVSVSQGVGNGRVVGREFLGDRTQYTLEVKGFRLTALAAPGIEFESGTSVNVTPSPEHLLFFDSADGQRIS